MAILTQERQATAQEAQTAELKRIGDLLEKLVELMSTAQAPAKDSSSKYKG